MPKATFFIPGWVIENHPDAVYPIVCTGHEIGAHGYLHERPDTLSLEEEDAILDKSVAIIRELTGRSPAGFRAPAWEFSPNTLELLGKHSFLYSSNMMDSIYPYFHRRQDGSPTLVELPVHWELDDAPFFLFLPGQPRPMAPIWAVFDTWRAEFQAYYRLGGNKPGLPVGHCLLRRPGNAGMARLYTPLVRSGQEVLQLNHFDQMAILEDAGVSLTQQKV